MIQDCTNTKIDMPSSRFDFYQANNQSCKHINTKIYLKFDTLNSKLQLNPQVRPENCNLQSQNTLQEQKACKTSDCMLRRLYLHYIVLNGKPQWFQQWQKCLKNVPKFNSNLMQINNPESKLNLPNTALNLKSSATTFNINSELHIIG